MVFGSGGNDVFVVAINGILRIGHLVHLEGFLGLLPYGYARKMLFELVAGLQLTPVGLSAIGAGRQSARSPRQLQSRPKRKHNGLPI